VFLKKQQNLVVIASAESGFHSSWRVYLITHTVHDGLGDTVALTYFPLTSLS